jgi:hypothetical protein
MIHPAEPPDCLMNILKRQTPAATRPGADLAVFFSFSFSFSFSFPLSFSYSNSYSSLPKTFQGLIPLLPGCASDKSHSCLPDKSLPVRFDTTFLSAG